MPHSFDLQLHHVALTVTDMEKATWFYGEVLGLRPLEVPDNPTPWAQIHTTDPDGNVIEFNVDRETILAR